MFRTVVLGLVFFIANFAYGGWQKDLVNAEQHFNSLHDEVKPYIVYFTTSDIPPDLKVKIPIQDVNIPLKDASVMVLDFMVHSLSPLNVVAKVKSVPNSDLYWIDIRNYGWSIDAWREVSARDPYFREPWTAPYVNNIVRASWFIVNTSDVTKQDDYDDKNHLYYELLYSYFEEEPDTIEEFREIWGVDLSYEDRFKDFITGTNVDYDKSGVARHNRQLARIRTVIGYYHETSDVKNNRDFRDYIENLEAGVLGRSKRDAVEAIGTNPLNLQVYFLGNGAGKRVEFADPTVAWDRSDKKDVRVRTPRSCIICHASGLNPSAPALKQMLGSGNVELLVYDPLYKQATQSFYLSDYGLQIQDDNELFQRAIKRINGLEPAINAYLYRSVMEWYEQSVTIEQCAFEVDVAVEDFKIKTKITTGGRIADLFNGNVIPREIWDNVNLGGFAQAMILTHNLQLPQSPQKYESKQLRIKNETNLMSGEKLLEELAVGGVYNIIANKPEHNGWIKIKTDENEAYVWHRDVELLNEDYDDAASGDSSAE